jgi:hypothetical protein
VRAAGPHKAKKPSKKEGTMSVAQRKSLVITGAACVMLLAAFVLASFSSAGAAEVKEPVQLNAGSTLADNLVALKGKTVTVNLAAGASVTGIVKDVKNNLLHLEKLSQKEFYDALVTIDKIASVEVRAR